MSRVVIVEKNKHGKIELTKDELQKMLDDAYSQGYADGKKKYNTATSNSIPLNKCENSVMVTADNSCATQGKTYGTGDN